MVGLNRSSQRFLESYEQRFEQFEIEAELVRGLVREIARSTGALIHTVKARAKTPESVLGKLRRKHYSDPDRQMRDLIGVRVITFYSDDVDLVVDRLKHKFEIDSSDSVDKRVRLGLHDFGYRSVHLIARLKPAQARSKKYHILSNQWFEVQVRSILEHAWAEISHEIFYKSGVQYPEEMVRRFASLAGTLELLDNEFLTLRDERDELIDRYREIYANHGDNRNAFDVARLLGFMEASWPEGRSWRQAAEAGVPFQPGLDTSCVDALKAVGLGTPRSLRNVFESREFRDAVASFASSHGIAPEHVSHLAVVLLALAVKDPNVLKRHFPEIEFDSAIEQMVRKRSEQ